MLRIVIRVRVAWAFFRTVSADSSPGIGTKRKNACPMSPRGEHFVAPITIEQITWPQRYPIRGWSWCFYRGLHLP
jgi:hypothetical protein